MASAPVKPDTDKPTTIKVSTGVRDRLKTYGGATYEDTVVEALDALDTQRFWAEADAALAVLEGWSDGERTKLAGAEADLDAVWDGLED